MSTKSRLLELLEQNRGKYLSGNELAKMLDVSRTAVWKGMKSLQQEGYSITAVTNKGYLLEEDNNILSEEAVRLQLKNTEVLVEVWKEIASTNQRMKQLAVEKRLPHGSVVVAQLQTEGKGQLKNTEVLVEVWKEIASTNQRMKQLAVEKRLPHGSVVVAQLQTEGKGRKGRKFYSPKDSGLYLSVLLYPEKTAQKSLEITAAAAVAVCKAVENWKILFAQR